MSVIKLVVDMVWLYGSSWVLRIKIPVCELTEFANGALMLARWRWLVGSQICGRDSVCVPGMDQLIGSKQRWRPLATIKPSAAELYPE